METKHYVSRDAAQGSFSTDVVFSGTVSFRNRDAAQQLLDSVGSVVEQSVAVIHDKSVSPSPLISALQTIASLLHHFEDNVERDDEHSDLEFTKQTSSRASNSIDGLLRILRAGHGRAGGGWTEDQRFDLAELFKTLFEDLVLLMQISEAQQAKGFLRNIRIVRDTLNNVYNTNGRTAYLHNANLRGALPVLIRGANNRGEVAREPRLKDRFRDISSKLESNGRHFCDWVEARQHDTVTESQKRAEGRGLEEALDQLYSAVEVRLGSNASFGYRFIERERFGASLDALIASLRSDDRQQVVQAAKDITQIVKDADEKGLGAPLKEDTKALLVQAQKGDAESAAQTAEKLKAEMDKAADKEEQIKGKRIYGTLPSAIQSMAALLKSREAQDRKPAAAAGTTPQAGAKAPEAPVKEEKPDGSAPAYSIIKQVHRDVN